MSYFYSPYSRYSRSYEYSPSRSVYNTPYWGSQYSPRGASWIERIPVEQRYTDYVAESRIDYRPVERRYTDYMEIQHTRDYVPVPRMERRVEYVPVDRYEERVDYMPVERSQVLRSPERYPMNYSRVARSSYPSRYY